MSRIFFGEQAVPHQTPHSYIKPGVVKRDEPFRGGSLMSIVQAQRSPQALVRGRKKQIINHQATSSAASGNNGGGSKVLKKKASRSALSPSRALTRDATTVNQLAKTIGLSLGPTRNRLRGDVGRNFCKAQRTGRTCTEFMQS